MEAMQKTFKHLVGRKQIIHKLWSGFFSPPSLLSCLQCPKMQQKAGCLRRYDVSRRLTKPVYFLHIGCNNWAVLCFHSFGDAIFAISLKAENMQCASQCICIMRHKMKKRQHKGSRAFSRVRLRDLGHRSSQTPAFQGSFSDQVTHK